MTKKNIIIIQTPPWALKFISVTDMMTDEELVAAKLERPDLIFKLANELPDLTDLRDVTIPVEDISKGITITGMTLPSDFEDQIRKLENKL
jgi:hypothetical protein